MTLQIFVLNGCLDVNLKFSWTNTAIGISLIFQQVIGVPFSVIIDYFWQVNYFPTPGLVFASISL
jgi:hypothetical protein